MPPKTLDSNRTRSSFLNRFFKAAFRRLFGRDSSKILKNIEQKEAQNQDTTNDNQSPLYDNPNLEQEDGKAMTQAQALKAFQRGEVSRREMLERGYKTPLPKTPDGMNRSRSLSNLSNQKDNSAKARSQSYSNIAQESIYNVGNLEIGEGENRRDMTTKEAVEAFQKGEVSREEMEKAGYFYPSQTGETSQEQNYASLQGNYKKEENNYESLSGDYKKEEDVYASLQGEYQKEEENTYASLQGDYKKDPETQGQNVSENTDNQGYQVPSAILNQEKGAQDDQGYEIPSAILNQEQAQQDDQGYEIPSAALSKSQDSQGYENPDLLSYKSNSLPRNFYRSRSLPEIPTPEEQAASALKRSKSQPNISSTKENIYNDPYEDMYEKIDDVRSKLSQLDASSKTENDNYYEEPQDALPKIDQENDEYEIPIDDFNQENLDNLFQQELKQEEPDYDKASPKKFSFEGGEELLQESNSEEESQTNGAVLDLDEQDLQSESQSDPQPQTSPLKEDGKEQEQEQQTDKQKELSDLEKVGTVRNNPIFKADKGNEPATEPAWKKHLNRKDQGPKSFVEKDKENKANDSGPSLQ
jgi:hypothetical protein